MTPPKRPRFSRWRRLPGVARVMENRIPLPTEEPQRVTLYLRGDLLDEAEAQAMRHGAETIQEYCADLLKTAIEAERERDRQNQANARLSPLEVIDEIASDPDYLANWKFSHLPIESDPEPPEQPSLSPPVPPTPATPPARPEAPPMSAAREVVLRHATLVDDDPSALLAALRRGEPIAPDAAQELLQALIDLEREYRDVTQLDRRLAYALHRLAFEGQILLTEAWPGLPVDPGTIDVMRIVQEAVDRVLSGDDIRYYAEGTSSESSS